MGLWALPVVPQECRAQEVEAGVAASALAGPVQPPLLLSRFPYVLGSTSKQAGLQPAAASERRLRP